jgi:hypothetical protein
VAGDRRSGGGLADGRRLEERRWTFRWPETGGAAADLPMAGDGRSGGGAGVEWERGSCLERREPRNAAAQ